MKTHLSRIILSTLLAASAFALVPPAMAQTATVVGPVTKIKLAADGKSAVATLKDNKTGESVNVDVNDDLTLDKFKDKRIVEGDEIRAKFDKEGGKNHSKFFKKTAGC
ncbi:MAG TPA: hypothetical protein VJ698_07195 [Noviherbaspirillum sp.]|uniref:hypothetical protein n=1 Tax=Noviherbaspirillum sp. TaxID=1926288 RepID=UPI002B489DB8|nr:hypothetical protein [Noviherbaspirillum sp.]HJV85246.1 hypothetical protein [Noviherbaspirillum sp.]